MINYTEEDKRQAIEYYFKNGRKPWSTGYNEYKEEFLKSILYSEENLDIFRIQKKLPENYGIYLDERAVEYPWLFSKLLNKKQTVLDAGSILNYNYIVNHKFISNKDLTIMTLSPESSCFFQNKISYLYGDMRDMPFRNGYFDEIYSISTVEHIGMNNTIYTTDSSYIQKEHDDYLAAIEEIKRVLRPGGRLLLSVPYGKFMDYGYYQQFNKTMIDKIKAKFPIPPVSETYFLYANNQWDFSTEEKCKELLAFNIHETKYFKKDSVKDYDSDLAACSRGIIALEFIKE
jgi:SAM-dependent methyltransferase